MNNLSHRQNHKQTQQPRVKKIALILLRILVAIAIALVIFPVLLLPSTTTVPPSIQILFAMAEVAWLVTISRFGFTVRVVLVEVAGFVAIALLAIFASQVFASTPPILDVNGKPISNSIAVLEKVKLGGSEEWISIRGKDSRNPVLLFLAGGPGGSQLVAARRALAGLEDRFVVVNWEQLGAGKSFDAVDRSITLFVALTYLFSWGIWLPTTTANTIQPSPPSATDTLAPPSDRDITSKADTYLSKLVKAKLFSGSVLIARNGKVFLSKGYGEADREKHLVNTAQTKFRIASLTKQFTAMAILILQTQGKLNVRDRICTYLSNCPASWQAITIHQLLTHTSGIPDFTRFPDYLPTQGSPSSPTQTIARFKDKPLDFQSGEKFSYSDSGYILLGSIIERASGATYEAFLRDNIFAPLQMVNLGYDHNNGDLALGYRDQTNVLADFVDMSIPYAAGGLYSTVEDLYRWDRALYTDKLIPKKLRDMMFTPFAMPKKGGPGYGYGWGIGKEGNHLLVSHEGAINGFQSGIYRYPNDKTVIIILGNRQDMDLFEMRTQIAKIVFEKK
jgi:CubicO group peptidase (beta-lactamase class C family)